MLQHTYLQGFTSIVSCVAIAFAFGCCYAATKYGYPFLLQRGYNVSLPAVTFVSLGIGLVSGVLMTLCLVHP